MTVPPLLSCMQLVVASASATFFVRTADVSTEKSVLPSAVVVVNLV